MTRDRRTRIARLLFALCGSGLVAQGVLAFQHAPTVGIIFGIAGLAIAGFALLGRLLRG